MMILEILAGMALIAAPFILVPVTIYGVIQYLDRDWNKKERQ
jgi:hypothetical protein